MLILTEKESVAKTYAKALNLKKTEKTLYESTDGKTKVTYAAGHLYELYEPEDYDKALKTWNYNTLPYIPQTYKFKPKADKFTNQLRIETEKQIRKAVTKNEEIVIATDPDREGEVIARIILDKCNVPQKLLKRIWACEGVNDEEVRKALLKRENADKYNKLFEVGLNQKKGDWIMGINLTRAYTILFSDSTVYSVGRVQTAVLKEIYNRECQRLLFVPQKYYEIEIETNEGVKFFINSECNSKKNITEKSVIDGFFRTLSKNGKIKVTDIREKEEKEKAPLLYDSAEIQAHAFEIYGIDVNKTLEICQNLYLDKGVTSYPRTACRFLKEEDFEELRKRCIELAKKYNLQNFDQSLITKDNKRYFNSKKIEGHHALIPCRWFEEKEGENYKIYEMILRRFLMMGMKDYHYKKQNVYAVSNGVTVFTRTNKIIEKGWKEIDYTEKREGNNTEIKKTDEFTVKDFKIIEKETEKPKAYTQSSILKFMKNPLDKDEQAEGKIYSIGTQATQANIIKTLFDRKYIEKKGKAIAITQKGIKFIEEVKENEILDKNTEALATTKWEEMNEKDPASFLSYIEKVTQVAVKNMEEKMQTVVMKKEAGICPACNHKIIMGKNGWYCEGVKEGCKNSIASKVMGNEIDESFIKNLIENKKSEVMKGVKKDGGVCEFYFKVDEKGLFTLCFLTDREICKCPKCGGTVSSFPKTYRCKNPECSFFIYRETYGTVFNEEDIKSLCQKESVEKTMTKKDGSKAQIKVKLSENYEKLEIEYLNNKGE